LQPTATGFAVGFLFAERYIVKQYSADWQPLDGDTTLVNELKLINGQLPFIHFAYTGSEFVVIYALLNERGLMDLHEQRRSDLASPGSDVILLTDLAPASQVQAVATTQGTAVLAAAPNLKPQLNSFLAAGQPVATSTLDQLSAATAYGVVSDGSDWLVFSQTSTGLEIEKLTNLGAVMQRVTLTFPKTVPLPQGRLQHVVRSGDYLAILWSDQLLVLSDNLSSVYGWLSVSSDQLYPRVAFHDAQLYLSYNQPLSLTDYQIDVVTVALDKADTAIIPD
jgi:hypothetical protein